MAKGKTKPMDKTEVIADRHLRGLGCTDVVFQENDPPDFVVNGTIAVEVRRLNQHADTPSGSVGLESDQIAMDRLIRRVTPEIDGAGIAENWFVWSDFERPLPKWKEVEKAIRNCLIAFRDAETRSAGDIKVLPNLNLHFIPGSYTGNAAFLRAGGYVDGDTGGWVIPELIRNVRICIEEKSRKTKEARSRFPVWWLLLVDYMGCGIATSEMEPLKQAITKHPDWDKIIIVNRQDASLLFDW